MSDQVIAAIEQCVDEWAVRTGHHCMVFYAGGEWVAACHMLSIRERGPDVMVVLRNFDIAVRKFQNHSDKLAQTLGLEAAE